ncbi:MAG: hypothetical protein WCP68_05045 [Enhydrobacter sp.]
MTPMVDNLIARLQADCTAAETAERTVRADYEARLKKAETARAYAWRRLNMLSEMARIAAAEPDCELAVERQLVALFREIGWIEGGLGELGESAQPFVSRLRPIAEALHAQCHPLPAADGDSAAEPPPDPITAFRAFETWYEVDRGQPLLQAFERYVPPTPLVEF